MKRTLLAAEIKKAEADCQNYAVDTKTDCGQLFSIPEGDIHKKCSNEIDTADSGPTDKDTCLCKQVKNWAYDSCKVVFKHVDRRCIARYQKLLDIVHANKKSKHKQADKALKKEEQGYS